MNENGLLLMTDTEVAEVMIESIAITLATVDGTTFPEAWLGEAKAVHNLIAPIYAARQAEAVAATKEEWSKRIAAAWQQGHDDGLQEPCIVGQIADAREAARKAERKRIWGELEDIRCCASGDYLPGIERLMKELEAK